MKPASSTLSSAEASFRRNERIGFGPYLAFEAVPWLLLATVIRIYSRALPDSLLLLGFLAVHVPVFVAFLLASQRMIDLSGGSTSLERLPFTYQLSLSWAVIWRLFILFVATIIGAVSFGMDKNLAARFWVGFDGIVFAWGWGFLPFWSALIATIVFVMIVEKGLNRKPTFLSVLRQFRARWKYLTQAAAIIGLLFLACNFAQLFTGKLVLALGEQLGHPLGKKPPLYRLFRRPVLCATLVGDYHTHLCVEGLLSRTVFAEVRLRRFVCRSLISWRKNATGLYIRIIRRSRLLRMIGASSICVVVGCVERQHSCAWKFGLTENSNYSASDRMRPNVISLRHPDILPKV